MIDFTPGSMDMKALQQAISIANLLFCGHQVTINDKPVPASPATVRRGVKYISLDEDSRKIWDDPDMLPAHKYQNIPQVDISTYVRDYCSDCGAQYGPIRIGSSSIVVDFRYSASGERHTVDMDMASDTLPKFFKITHIDRLMQLVKECGEVIHVESNLSMLVFREDSITDMLMNGNPFYDVNIGHVFETFSLHPKAEIYVPYRQGWSKVLNITSFHRYADHGEYAISNGEEKFVNLLDVSAISVWDGISTKIENHGVKVEDLKTNTVESFDTFEHKMRRLVGTHEQILDVVITPEDITSKNFYAVYTIKGINVNGFEFDMS